MLKVLKMRQLLYLRKPPSSNDSRLQTRYLTDFYSEMEINPKLIALTQEYYRLSKIDDPTEAEIERLAIILDLAQYDIDLSSFINEADHLIAYELGLVEDDQEPLLTTPKQAIVEQSIAPNRPGKVRYQGNAWLAQLYQHCQQTAIASGQIVDVIEVVGNTLLVTPVSF